jgi:P27 family predicted phage terminase small subunit
MFTNRVTIGRRPGRPPKSPEVRRLEGNPGKRPIPKPAVQAKGSPEVPDYLDEDAQACIALIRRSLPPKVFAALDGMLLTTFACAWSLHKQAVLAIRDKGVIGKGSMKQPVVNPWVRILNDQARIMLALSPRLYLDPVARLQLRVDEAPRSKFDGLTAPNGSSGSLNS